MDGLERFKKAQEYDYQIALKEVKQGRKTSHWIWYIFPQVKGLGRSYYSDYYGIGDLEEAKAYIQDETLGSRLIEISNELLSLDIDDPITIFGYIDSKKVRSCMTLFSLVSEHHIFNEVLNKYYDGQKDDKTLTILGIK